MLMHGGILEMLKSYLLQQIYMLGMAQMSGKLFLRE